MFTDHYLWKSSMGVVDFLKGYEYKREILLLFKWQQIIASEKLQVLVFIFSEFGAAVIHDQDTEWGNSVNTTPFEPFSNSTVKATCTCKYYLKITEEKTQNERKYCSHIIGQLRRVIFML